MLIAGDITLDEERFIVCRAKHPLSLTHVEFASLATLMCLPRRVRIRNELLAAVWGHDHTSDDKVLDVAISRLRTKAEAALATVDRKPLTAFARELNLPFPVCRMWRGTSSWTATASSASRTMRNLRHLARA